MFRVLILPFLAVIAGTVSFSSPCCLPLVPGYLSYVSALPVAGLDAREARSQVLRAAVLFVAGFTAVFTVLGASFAVVGSVVLRQVSMLTRISGLGIIALGLVNMGVLRLGFLTRERRVDMARIPTGPRSAFFVGMAFSLGWAPCIGPVLATILTAAAATQTVAWGAILLALYSLGLGLPFIALALGMHRGKGSLRWLRVHGQTIERFGGVVMVFVGVLFVSGRWGALFLPLQRYFARFGWPPI